MSNSADFSMNLEDDRFDEIPLEFLGPYVEICAEQEKIQDGFSFQEFLKVMREKIDLPHWKALVHFVKFGYVPVYISTGEEEIFIQTKESNVHFQSTTLFVGAFYDPSFVHQNKQHDILEISEIVSNMPQFCHLGSRIFIPFISYHKRPYPKEISIYEIMESFSSDFKQFLPDISIQLLMDQFVNGRSDNRLVENHKKIKEYCGMLKLEHVSFANIQEFHE